MPFLKTAYVFTGEHCVCVFERERERTGREWGKQGVVSACGVWGEWGMSYVMH